MKKRLSQWFLPGMEPLKEIFPKILSVKHVNKAQNNFSSNQDKRQDDPFNISVAVTCYRDNNEQRKLTFA